MKSRDRQLAHVSPIEAHGRDRVRIYIEGIRNVCVVDLSPLCVRLHVCTGCAQGVPKMCQGCAQGAPRVCTSCGWRAWSALAAARGVHKVCPGCAQGVPRCAQGEGVPNTSRHGMVMISWTDHGVTKKPSRTDHGVTKDVLAVETLRTACAQVCLVCSAVPLGVPAGCTYETSNLAGDHQHTSLCPCTYVRFYFFNLARLPKSQPVL